MGVIKVIGKRLGIFLLKFMPIYIALYMFFSWADKALHPTATSGVNGLGIFIASLLFYFFMKLFITGGSSSKESIASEIRNAQMGRDAYLKSATKRKNPEDSKRDVKTAEKFQKQMNSLNEKLKDAS